ncbi:MULTISPECIES: dTMP kinase [unclassified Parafrankia]|uniref:dTMP kinase n=1 Tax=unclassified Parafrankia TaxID=2994368 RepID=UPI000DA47647|nr:MULTISPECIES: dTMP kinase [unclassified Parafrankia]TCJ40683.1 dTMP kinase [Parafrankia sp. BMG5.11]SQD99240.1 dTMP kinase [Parafrankia sp. Ea1.12]
MDLPVGESHGKLDQTPLRAARAAPREPAATPVVNTDPPSANSTSTDSPTTDPPGTHLPNTEPPGTGPPAGRRAPRPPRMRVRRPLSRHPVTTVPSPPRARTTSGSDGDLRAVLRIPEFRRMWIQLSLSSLGDWMGLLATTALVTQLTESFSGQAFAISSLLIVRLLPALVLGPLAGAIADRLDRRMTMVITDVMRFGLFLSIPIVGTLGWLLIASFLVECVSLVWAPAKEASIPHLVPRNRLAAANTLSLITTYGTAPLAAAIFTLLATVSRALGPSIHFFRDSSLDIALYFNAATFLGSAIVIWGLRSIGRAERPEHSTEPGFFASITEGWKFVGQDRLVRGLVVGILGGFAGAGCVVALGKLYVEILGGGDSAYGVLFGAVFIGLAAGMGAGPKLLGDYSRTRLFGVCVTAAGITLVIVAIIPNLVIACILVVFVGALAGVAWVTGYTLLQAEVADELRGRTFALVQSLVRVDLLVVLAAAPALVGLIGSHQVHLWGDINVRADGVTVVLLAGGLLAVAVGLFSYRQMDDHTGEAVLPELWNALRGRRPGAARRRHGGLFITVEGAAGAGKTTQLELLRSWLSSSGREVVPAYETDGTSLGAGLRDLLDDPANRLHARTELLLDAADRAEHVARVIEPALARGAIVLTDRYVDSAIACQALGQRIDSDELTVLTQWASHSLLPDVTILLDLPAEQALARGGGDPHLGRESEDDGGGHDGGTGHDGGAGHGGGAVPGAGPDRSGTDPVAAVAYHRRVREHFRRLADEDPDRHVILDATLSPQELHRQIRAVIAGRLRPAITGDDPR